MNQTVKIILKIVCYLLLIAIIGGSIYAIVKFIPEIPGYEDIVKPKEDKTPTEINDSEELIITDTIDFNGFNQRYGFVNGTLYYSEQFVKEIYNSSNCENPNNDRVIKCGTYTVELRMNTNNIPYNIYMGSVLPTRDYENYTLKLKYDQIAEIKEITLDEKGVFRSEGNFNICSIRYKGEPIAITPFMIRTDPGFVKAVLCSYSDMKNNYYIGFFNYSMKDLYKRCFEITPVPEDPYKDTEETFFDKAKKDVEPLMYTSIVTDITDYTLEPLDDSYPTNSFITDIEAGNTCFYLGNLFNGYDYTKCSVVIENEDCTLAKRIYLNEFGCINYESDKAQRVRIFMPRYDNVRFSFDRLVLCRNKDQQVKLVKTKYIIEGVECYGVLSYHEEAKFSTEL